MRIVPRQRGAPLDKLVAELMILANSSWGELLAERDIAGDLPRAVGGQGAHVASIPSRTKGSACPAMPG